MIGLSNKRGFLNCWKAWTANSELQNPHYEVSIRSPLCGMCGPAFSLLQSEAGAFVTEQRVSNRFLRFVVNAM